MGLSKQISADNGKRKTHRKEVTVKVWEHVTLLILSKLYQSPFTVIVALGDHICNTSGYLIVQVLLASMVEAKYVLNPWQKSQLYTIFPIND